MHNHPILFLNARRIETARHNIERFDWAKQVVSSLKADADRLADMPTPVFETEWWQEAKTRHWSQTYPEINYHTGSAVRPAIYAAYQSTLYHALSGNPLYAERVKKVLLHFTSFSFEPKHPDVGLNYASWGIQALTAYDTLFDLFTIQEKESLDDFFTCMLSAIAENDEWWIAENPGGRFNNHYTWHKLMMAAYGIFYGREEWIERALNSEEGIKDLIEHGFLDDGLWFESSLNYHYTALHGLNRFADMFRCAGREPDLYTHVFANGRTLEQGFSGMVQVLFPNMTIPQIGDTYGYTAHLSDEPSIEYAWNAYNSDVYGWLLSQKRREPGIESLFREKEPSVFDPPSVKSRIFPEHGYVILRSVEGQEYWNSDSWSVFLSWDLDSVHAHNDKMNLILFGRGKLLGQDCNAVSTAAHAFSARVQADLNRRTICHNTLMVDGADHRGTPEKLQLTEFKRLSNVKTATVADYKGLVYPGVKLQRTVAVTDTYVLDVFQASSDEEHDYDWLFHSADDEGITRIDADFQPVNLPDIAPWNWLKDAKTAKVDGTWQAEWRQDYLRFRMTMLGSGETAITTCGFPSTDTLEPPFIPMLIARRRGKSAVFAAVYQAERNGLTNIRLTCMEDRYGMLRFRIESGDIGREHLIPKIEQAV